VTLLPQRGISRGPGLKPVFKVALNRGLKAPSPSGGGRKVLPPVVEGKFSLRWWKESSPSGGGRKVLPPVVERKFSLRTAV